MSPAPATQSMEAAVLEALRAHATAQERPRGGQLSQTDRAAILAYENDPCAASVAAASRKRRRTQGHAAPLDAAVHQLSSALEARIRQSPLWHYSLPSLRSACAALETAYDSRSTKGQLIYEVLTDVRTRTQAESPLAPTPWTPDDSQQAALRAFAEHAHLLLYGGPGSGKTETLLEMVSRVPSDKRALLLLYTVDNERMALRRLRARGLSRPFSANRLRSAETGVFVATFDKYAHRRLPAFDGARGTGGFCASSEDYGRRFEQALGVGRQSWEAWDYVFVDECQDLGLDHERLVSSLGAPRTVRAGDPRQEVYEGSGRFSAAWRRHDCETAVRCALRYNHRSSPQIVAMLNAYSLHTFGEDLHVEQMSARAMRSDDPGRSLRAVLEPDSVALAGAVTSCAQAGDFVIAPVSVNKYAGTASLVAAIRQSIVDYSESRLFALVVEDKNVRVPPSGAVLVANAYRVKGLECRASNLVQCDVAYEQLNVSRERLARLLFVALSRARDAVTLALARPLRDCGLLACVARHFETVTIPVAVRPTPLPRKVALRDDLCQSAVGVAILERAELPPLLVTDARAADFVGVFVEGQVARSLGARCCERWQLHTLRPGDEPFVHIEADTAHVHCPHAMRAAVQGALETLAEADPEICYAAVRYTLLAGVQWTLGTELLAPSVPSALRSLVGPAVSRSARMTAPLTAHRSSRVLGHLCGITDVETSSSVLEVKHTGAQADVQAERRQAALYGALREKAAYLYRSLAGTLERLQAPRLAVVLNLARAQLAMKQAQARRRIVPPTRATTAFSSWSRVIVVVDVESLPLEGTLLEIGALALDSQSGRVLDVFHHLDGAVDALDHERADAVDALDLGRYGIRAVATQDLSPEESTRAFRFWASAWLHADFVAYAGREHVALGIPEGTVVWRDARQLFLAWLSKQGCARQGASRLEDAIDQLFGEPDIFVPHRAFEDAVATAMISYLLLPRGAV